MKRTPIERKTGLTRGGPLNQFSPGRLADFEAAGVRPRSTFTNPAKVPAQRVAQDRQPRRPRVRYTGPSKATVAKLEVRCGGFCEFWGCGRQAQDPHHRDERGSGGRGVKAPAWINKLCNLLAACRRHNDWVSNGSPTKARELGWLIPMGDATPYTVPVLTRHHAEKVYLLDDGTWALAAAVSR